eukprot:873588-Pelagomonas_calceolata.AAC.2
MSGRDTFPTALLQEASKLDGAQVRQKEKWKALSIQSGLCCGIFTELASWEFGECTNSCPKLWVQASELACHSSAVGGRKAAACRKEKKSLRKPSPAACIKERSPN